MAARNSILSPQLRRRPKKSRARNLLMSAMGLITQQLPGLEIGNYALNTSSASTTLTSTSNSTMPNTDISGVYSVTETFKAVHYGPGSLTTALPKLLEVLSAKRALIITGRSLATKVNIFLSANLLSLSLMSFPFRQMSCERLSPY